MLDTPICPTCGMFPEDHPHEDCDMMWDWNNAPTRGWIPAEMTPYVDPYEHYLETRYWGMDEEEARYYGRYEDM